MNFFIIDFSSVYLVLGCFSFYLIIMDLKIATLNANGLCYLNKRMGILQWLSHLAFDVVCPQEVHVISLDECTTWFSCYGYLIAASCGPNHSCGNVILYRPVYSLISCSSDSNGRFVSCDFLAVIVVFVLFLYMLPM